jgi:hypothetical protein
MFEDQPQSEIDAVARVIRSSGHSMTSTAS